MTATDRIIQHVLENDEEPEYIETERKLRPETAAKLQAEYDAFQSRIPDHFERSAFQSITIGRREFYKQDGDWYETIRRKNPAYWDQPNYFIIAPGPGDLTFIACKHPRRLTNKNFQKAYAQIFKDATGKSAYSERPIVEGLDKFIFDKCADGRRPEPAYEIFIDGTWKRLK